MGETCEEQPPTGLLTGPTAGPSTGPPTGPSAGASAGPLTWGQQDIWRAVVAAAPQERYLTIVRSFAAPRRRPVTVERAALALERLVARHESLRTRLTGPRDAPLQQVSAVVRPLYEVVAEPVEEVCERLAAEPFAYWDEWPLRVAFVVDGGYVRHIVLVLCHLAADGHAAELLVKDFRLLLLRDTLPPSDGATPRELAAWQHSDAGRRVSEAAIAWWLEEYARMDPVPPYAHTPEEPRFLEATLRSPGLAAATRAVAARNRVSSSTVLLAAAMRLAGGLTGQRHCGMRVIVNNRFAAGRRDAVATISQEALVVLDLDAPSFDALVRQAWGRAMRAYRQAQYDPYAMEAAVTGAGPGIRSFGCFNDQRLAQEDGAAGASTEPAARRNGAPGEKIEMAAARTDGTGEGKTEVAWTDAMDRNICDFRLHVGGEPGGMEVSCYADTALLPPSGIERYLLDLEGLILEAARA
ncbi:non-ribosomal peptide synthetase condensation domain protein [Nonomuraea phyllanthi]|uniref:condensation domain-containing protein n=1 Tax=Nonomuraea phyllanthi TaxID=2219224 RepID=UPI0012931D97|nr:condensation domain-containing protein [Nonomuraea phyllanthi]QFY08862.1 non-ribosomal peptide synthetase condensation domain protein [Nonomuraea phyllanthi]